MDNDRSRRLSVMEFQVDGPATERFGGSGSRANYMHSI